MAKLILLAFLLAVHAASGIVPKCTNNPLTELPTKWKTMAPSCITKVKKQVQMEMNAAITYLAMGSHFLQYDVNRPGFAKLFLESASEERQHGIKLLEYLLMRGQLTGEEGIDKLEDIIQYPTLQKGPTWTSGRHALSDALELETKVTESIRDIIIQCEKEDQYSNPRIYNDYHLSDWLTGEYLEEQYKGQRDLAGKLSTLSKMEKQNPLAEFLFDKTLL